jgi:hypothetical protein
LSKIQLTHPLLTFCCQHPFPTSSPARAHSGKWRGFAICPEIPDKLPRKGIGAAELGKDLIATFSKPLVVCQSTALPLPRRQGNLLRAQHEFFRNEGPPPLILGLTQGEALPKSPQPVPNLRQDLLNRKLLNFSFRNLLTPFLPNLEQVIANFILMWFWQA